MRKYSCSNVGIVHPKIKILLSFTHPVHKSFILLLNTKEDHLKNVANQIVEGRLWLLWKSVTTVSCFVCVCVCVCVCVSLSLNNYTGLEQAEGK